MEILVIVAAIVVTGELYYWYKRLADRQGADDPDTATWERDFPATQAVPVRTETNPAGVRGTGKKPGRSQGGVRF